MQAVFSVLKTGGEAHSNTPRRPDGVAREETSEVDHIEDVRQILAVDLKLHLKTLRLVDIHAGGCIDLERRIDAPAVKVDSSEDLRAIEGKRFGWVAAELERQASTVLNSASNPKTGLDLVAQAAANGVALVLGVREVTGESRFGFARIIPEKEAAGDGEPGVAELV
jgi:hypothetical protein